MVDTRNNPSFLLFPLNNSRTGYKPFSMPVVYIEPHRVDQNNNNIPNSDSLRLRYYVVDAPDPAKVAGPFNTNLRIPDQSLFEKELTNIEKYKKLINISNYPFYDSGNNPIQYINAKEGDYFEYTLSWTIQGSNPVALVPYYPDAYYYDLSDIAFDVEKLPRLKNYFFVWESTFFRRFTTATGDLKCISSEIAISKKALVVNHPGDIHEFMFNATPQLYFSDENFDTSNNPTLEFYRPFADALQDIFDEQSLLNGINQINTIPVEYIPYLAYLIGWDLPNFPGTDDDLRRQILRRASELQKLKGSRRSIEELFEMFGFVIDIVNLYASLDGNKYLSVNDGLTGENVLQLDMLLSDYNAEGFGVGNVPFTFRPTRRSQIILYAWLVQPNSQSYQDLKIVSNNLSTDLEYYNSNLVSIDQDGLLRSNFIDQISSDGVIGYSKVVVNNSSVSVGRPVINSNNIKYDNKSNFLSLFFDHDLGVDENAKVFIFAAYERFKIVVPDYLSNTRTNKFDVEILDEYGKSVDFNLLLFLLNFLFKLKAFHSLLRKIRVAITNNEIYNVTDLCINGSDVFAPGTALGDLQTPPPSNVLSPSEAEQCREDNNRGYKQSDLLLRQLILNGLEEEFQAWKLLANDCSKTKYGQDKVKSENIDLDYDTDNRPTICDNNPDKHDYCYKRRVVDQLKNELVVPSKEYWYCNPCGLSLGNGIYWESDYLHYYDRNYYNDNLDTKLTYINKLHNLNITKDNLNFPSCKFLTMNKLKFDYDFTEACISLGYDYDYCKKRPWDNWDRCIYSDLNARIVENIEGIEELIWDNTDLVYISNGLDPDIPSLDNHTLDHGRIVVHKIYQYTKQINQAVMLDCDYTLDKLVDLSESIISPIFKTACGEVDYKGGYPSSFNEQFYNIEVRYEDGNTDEDTYLFCDNLGNCHTGHLNREAIADAFGISHIIRNTAIYFGSTSELIYDNNTQYKYYIPYRLDCLCNEYAVDCSDTNGELNNKVCNSSLLYDNDGYLDVNCDRLELINSISIREYLCVCSRISNYDLPNLFCLNDDCLLPENGKFRYKDVYDVIYESEWEIFEDLIDILVVIKDPRIPCEDPDGYIERGKIFKKGVITTIRQLLKYTNGEWVVYAEGAEWLIGYFQINNTCGNVSFENPFSYGINCIANDKVELFIVNGTHWSENGENNSYIWSDPIYQNPKDMIWVGYDGIVPDLSSASSESDSSSS